jgi:hypothetical protein
MGEETHSTAAEVLEAMQRRKIAIAYEEKQGEKTISRNQKNRAK